MKSRVRGTKTAMATAASAVVVGAVVYGVWSLATVIADRDTIFETARTLPYDRSCPWEGSPSVGSPGSCAEAGGYRFFRAGLGTAIARMDEGRIHVIFSDGLGADGADIAEIHVAAVRLRGR